MRQFLRRLAYLLGFLLWLLVMLFPCVTMVLLVRGEISWVRDAQTRDRLYLIQQRDATGVGYSSSRPVASGEAGLACVRDSERILLWYPERRFDDVSTCSCSRSGAGGSEIPVAECP